MTRRKNSKTDGGQGDALLDRLQATLNRLPDQERMLNMSGTHMHAIRKGLECRGDPFAKEDVLVLVDANGRKLIIPVANLPVRCGRSNDADYAINDARASRVHFSLRADGPFILLEDSGTTNGTILNGRRIATPAYLAEGDKILVGETELTVVRS